MKVYESLIIKYGKVCCIVSHNKVRKNKETKYCTQSNAVLFVNVCRNSRLTTYCIFLCNAINCLYSTTTITCNTLDIVHVVRYHDTFKIVTEDKSENNLKPFTIIIF